MHALPVKAVLPTAPAMAIRLRSAASCSTASATAELSKPIAMSTLPIIEPLPRECGADIGLVLMVGEHDLDRLAEHGAAGILDRHARGNDRARAAEIGIEAGLIVEDADPDDVVGDLRARGGRAKCKRWRELKQAQAAIARYPSRHYFRGP